MHFCIIHALDASRVQKRTVWVHYCIITRREAEMVHKCTPPPYPAQLTFATYEINPSRWAFCTASARFRTPNFRYSVEVCSLTVCGDR